MMQPAHCSIAPNKEGTKALYSTLCVVFEMLEVLNAESAA
jgi:hypothetical protein